MENRDKQRIKDQLQYAWELGQVIQSNHSGEWKDFEKQNQLDRPNFDYGNIENWRVKPESEMKYKSILQEAEKALWWYNLSLAKKKKIFDSRFPDDKFDLNKIHKEIITVLFQISEHPETPNNKGIEVKSIIEDVAKHLGKSIPETLEHIKTFESKLDEIKANKGIAVEEEAVSNLKAKLFEQLKYLSGSVQKSGFPERVIEDKLLIAECCARIAVNELSISNQKIKELEEALSIIRQISERGYDPYESNHHLIVERWVKIADNFLSSLNK